MRLVVFTLLVMVSLIHPITTLPLVFYLLLAFYVKRKDSIIFLYALIAGLIIDTLLLRSIGTTSLFLLMALFFVVLYERKFEVVSVQFVLLSSVLATIAYLLLFWPSLFLQNIVVGGVFSVFFFLLFPGEKASDRLRVE